MKILQIFGAVVAVHLLAFIFIFASPGCQSGPHNVPTPDATLPAEAPAAPITYNANAAPQAVDLGTPTSYPSAGAYGHAAPTRPGSPAAAAVAPARTTEDVTPVTTYTIQKGDSLWSVAKKNHLPVAELAKFNSMPTGAALKPGNKLKIPGKAASTTAAKDLAAVPPTAKASPSAPEKSAAPASAGTKYTVLPGESLGTIAHKHQVSVGELAAVNNITDPSKVRAGQQLIIPGSKTSAVKSLAPAATHSPASSKSSAPAATAGSSRPAAAGPATTPTAAPAPAPVQRFEITAPPPGQDLDAGLKEANAEVPTIKVEDSSGDQAAKK